ncbi:MAG TPA: membrane protein insertase YidC [Acidobacteriota bacterium]|nr:membrane protein insertase YidC [Acidobacteriota bacterium]
MEKRAIVAIGLSILVLFLFQYLFQRNAEQIPVTAPETVSQEKKPADPFSHITPPVDTAVITPKPASSQDTSAEAATIVIDGEHYRAVIDNRGAVIRNWELKHYKSSQKRVFDMIAGYIHGEQRLYPGYITFDDPELTDLANNEYYQVSIEGFDSTLTTIKPPATVVLRFTRGDFSIEKRYAFEADNYVAKVSIHAMKGGRPLPGHYLIGQDIGPEYEHFAGSRASLLQAVYFDGNKVRRESPPKDPNHIKTINGTVRWVGLDIQYFSIIAIPKQPLQYFNIQKIPIKIGGQNGNEIDRDLLRVTTPINGFVEYDMYIGPKKRENLAAVGSADLTGVINYGMFSILVYPLLHSLLWINQYVNNYGFAIVILTLFLSLIMFPLRLKALVSMKKMQAVQPQMKAIQEKYKKYKKTDPKRAEMNQEIMALYKTHKVNPLGGCLPMLLPLPFLIAFYRLLDTSIELRQATFIFWIQDLSLKDPIYVLPVLMGITMYISQKMMPMSPGMDPIQAKLMMMMPVILTILFLNFSSGLNLYFLCSNIFQIAFQKMAERWIIDRKSGDKQKKKPKRLVASGGK